MLVGFLELFKAHMNSEMFSVDPWHLAAVQPTPVNLLLFFFKASYVFVTSTLCSLKRTLDMKN